MKTQSLLLLLLFCAVTAYSQDSTNFQGKKFIKHDNVWYLKTENEAKYKVDTQTITIKFKEEKFIEDNLANALSRYSLKLLRKNELGYIDLEIPKNADIF